MKGKNKFDEYVCSRVRLARVAAGLSQEKLGAELGITFQQIQKTERAVNRISAGRLYEVASVTHKPIQWFYDGLPQNGNPGLPDVVAQVAATAQGYELIAAFANITDAKMRAAIVQIAVAASAEPPAFSED